MKSAIITGAAGAIGMALVDAFQGAGYHVVATDLRRAKVGDAFVECDLARFAREVRYRRRHVAAIRKALGKFPLHALVNNAATQRIDATADIKQKDWDETLAVNVSAPFFLVQAFASDLSRSSGSVTNIASIHSRLTKPGFAAYATSKAALVGLTRAIAVDFGGKFRSNAIAPAAVDTPMLRQGLSEKKLRRLAMLHPAGRLGAPADVAALALRLTEGPAFLTGSVIDLDGAIGVRLRDPE